MLRDLARLRGVGKPWPAIRLFTLENQDLATCGMLAKTGNKMEIPVEAKEMLMPLHPAKLLCVMSFALLGVASPSDASTIVTVPTDLAPGTLYRLVFLTSDTYQATSSSISTYNSDITNEVALIPQLAALGATWEAIASTDAVSAASNVGASDSSVGIYLLDGTTLIADGTGTTGNGLFSPTNKPIDLMDNGNLFNACCIWTGSNSDGTIDTGLALGDTAVELGAQLTNFSWLSGGASTESSQYDGNPPYLYGISSVLTVPASTTPEPRSIALAALGMAALCFARRRRLRNHTP